jgi:hypothetical protein
LDPAHGFPDGMQHVELLALHWLRRLHEAAAQSALVAQPQLPSTQAAPPEQVEVQTSHVAPVEPQPAPEVPVVHVP